MPAGRALGRVVSMAVLLAVTAAGAVAGVAGSAVRAHSGLAAASPGPGVVVGGSIERVRLFYLEPILEIDASVTSPSGVVLASEVVLVSEIEATIELAGPLDEPGEYAVRHEVLSSDGDRVPAAYLFTYDPEAPPPVLEIVPEEDDGGPPGWLLPAVVGVGAALLAVLAWRLVAARRRARIAADG